MLFPLLLLLADPTPEPEDVKAGGGALVLFLLLIAAVVLLGLSLAKQLRKAQAAKDAGVYGDEPVDTPSESADGSPPDDGPDTSADDSTGRGPGPSA